MAELLFFAGSFALARNSLTHPLNQSCGRIGSEAHQLAECPGSSSESGTSSVCVDAQPALDGFDLLALVRSWPASFEDIGQHLCRLESYMILSRSVQLTAWALSRSGHGDSGSGRTSRYSSYSNVAYAEDRRFVWFTKGESSTKS